MRSKLKIISGILFVVLLWSCAKKKYPESEVENDPVYYSRFSADGSQKEIKAGVDDYYLYTSATQDSTMVYALKSSFNKTGCSGCPGSLQIQINDYRISQPNSPVSIDSALQIKKYGFIEDGNSLSYVVKFKSSYSKGAMLQDFIWTFGDGSQSTGDVPVHTYSKAGKYDVCLKVTGTNACMNSNCNVQKISKGAFLAHASGTAAVGNTINFNAVTNGGKAPFQYLWNFGDGTSSPAISPAHTYTILGAYTVVLRVIDANNDTVISSYNAVTKTDNSSCATNYFIESISAVALNNLSKVAISWVDDNGVEFRSAAAVQPPGSSFEIVSIEQGQPNEKGEPTKKVAVRFSCRLFNGNKAVNISNGEATIAVAYK